MDSLRDFLKKAALLAAGGALPGSIRQALAIDPPPGRTWRDAEHVVILMQENRSFDHALGSSRGVRGFNDPRAVTLPNGNPVWLQTDDAGTTYAPFRLRLHDTKATWMGSLPHSWADQIDAWHGGKHDRWLRAKASGAKAFTINDGDPDFRELAVLEDTEGGRKRRMAVPKGDIFHRFRQGVREGRLPAVSWLVAPENFSDHPTAPWYGAWYVSEALSILVQHPQVWRKTIFILCYENDGYFDYVPPFVPPRPDRTGTGKVSEGIDTRVEYVSLEQEREYQRTHPGAQIRSGPIGLGYHVPLIVASPWSRGGRVCSPVFDHTSILQFLERWLTHKTGRPVREPNISSWRRAVCGDLTSVFRPHQGEAVDPPSPVARNPFLTAIHRAQDKPVPDSCRPVRAEEVAEAQRNPHGAVSLPTQETGTRPACALPYELPVDAVLNSDRRQLTIEFSAGNRRFGPSAAGAPFHVYAPGPSRPADGRGQRFEAGRAWAYAVRAGDRLTESWPLADFAEGVAHLRTHGPSGFFREFRVDGQTPHLGVSLNAPPAAAAVRTARLSLKNLEADRALTLTIEDLASGAPSQTVHLEPSAATKAIAEVSLDLSSSHGWYDVRVRVVGATGFELRYAGHVETGRESLSDPLMGRVKG